MKKDEYIIKHNIYGDELRLPKRSLLQRFKGHLYTITKHKIYVASGCFKIGLYRQGILHDLSKYSWKVRRALEGSHPTAASLARDSVTANAAEWNGLHSESFGIKP